MMKNIIEAVETNVKNKTIFKETLEAPQDERNQSFQH